MSELQRLLEIMAKLRDPDGGCPWDLEQTFDSIAPYTIEEAYEVDDAIRRRDWKGLQGELGDLLLQVVYHAQMAREEERFEFEDVAREICDKLVRRHPHVFGDLRVDDADAQTEAWDAYKEAERAERAEQEGRAPSKLDDVPLGLPALLRAGKLQRRAERAGLAWEEADERVQALETLIGPVGAREAGRWVFALAQVLRRGGHDAEEVAREANARFESDFRLLESLTDVPGAPDETLENLWKTLQG